MNGKINEKPSCVCVQCHCFPQTTYWEKYTFIDSLPLSPCVSVQHGLCNLKYTFLI